MKKVLQFLAMLLIVGTSTLYAQKGMPSKITADLESQINAMTSSTELVKVIIVMNDQYDATQNLRQIQYLDKAHKREYVVNELQRISNNGQKGLLNDLRIGEKFNFASNVKSFWIINAVSCSMTKDMIYAVAERPDVRAIIPDYEVRIPEGEDNENQIIEPGRGENQWNVVKVNADDVWETGVTGDGVVVAVIDSGVNYDHEDIANNMWDGGLDYPNHGWDYYNEDDDPMDDHSHGTHCAGTVSSYGTSGYQCGIAKDAKIMALKVLGAGGSGYTSYTWSAIQFALDHGANVLSMSLGTDGSGGVEYYRNLMENVLEAGVVASVAAGNTGNKYDDNGNFMYPVPYNVGSPGNVPSPWRNPDQTLNGGRAAVVTVGATTSDDLRSSFSSYGPVTWTEGSSIGDYYDYPYVEDDPINIGLIKPDVAAPGSSIVSLRYDDNGGYSVKSGTSMATPCVAGVMALMLEANPMLTPVEIDSILEVTAVPLGGYTSKNNYYGAGRVDAQAAVEAAVSMLAPGEIVVNPNTIDMGFRPNGAWMSPATLGLNNIGGTIEIQDIQISNPYFQIDLGDVTLPYSIGYHETLPVKVSTGNSSNIGTPIDAQITVYYGGGQQTQAMVTAIPYNPVVRDVWETAYQVNTFPFTDSLVPSSIPLYNNYNLPPTDVEDGADAVYKLVFDQDALLNASMTSGDDGKLVLYKEGFGGEGGPVENNCYTGPLDEGFSEEFEKQLGEGTSTTGYTPFYCLYNYSITQQLYLASELREAGMTKAIISSISWECSNTNNYLQKNITIWMANVEQNVVSSTSPQTSSMIKVYEGNYTPVVGWNEFVFNVDDFTWDGQSNILVCVQRNNGSWASGVSWYMSALDFTASAYSYTDNGSGYDMSTQTYDMSTSVNRTNTIFKGGFIVGSSIVDRTMSAGTYYLVTSSTSDAWGVEINTTSLSCPEEASHPVPADYEMGVNPTAVQLHWSLGDRTTEYKLLLGADYNDLETIVDWTRDLTESYTVTGLANNTNYFWQVLERNDGCPAGVEGPIWGFTTELNGPENLYANDYQFYEGDSVQLVWTAIENPYILSYNIYQDNVLIGNTAENEYTVSGLTYNMDGYYFHVTAVYAGGESNNSNEVVVQFSGNGSVAGHVYEQDGVTPIEGVSVAFKGHDEYGYQYSNTFTTDANGQYNGAIRAGSYNVRGVCDGYQSKYYQGVVSVVYNETTSGIDLVMDETYYPVNEVWAEYYPDASNVNSGSVRVKWSNSNAGWHTYCESEFNNAVGNGDDTPSWAYEYPASFLSANYLGCYITKVSLFSDAMYYAVGGNYSCRIYVGGNEPAAGTMMSTITVDVPAGLDAWVDWDLTTPVFVSGNDPIWVVWTANTHDSNWPAGCCGDVNELGTWWKGGESYDWEHLSYGTWTMRQWFSNLVGRSVAVGPINTSPVAVEYTDPVNSGTRGVVKGGNGNSAVCVNPNAKKGDPLVWNTPNRSFNHYRVYRTDAYNNGPFNVDNTVLVADNVSDTLYVDDAWQNVDNGVYKYGISRVYEGNRGDARGTWDLLMSFSATSGSQYGVSCDGQYIYMSKWNASDFYKYDLQGNFIESFVIDGVGQIRNITTDGQYFYGGSNGSIIYCFDLANKAYVGEINTNCSSIRHISYDPVNDGFWVGSWSDLMLVNRFGEIVTTGPALSNCGGSGYYTAPDGSAHLYLFIRPTYVYDYDIASNTIGEEPIFDFVNTPDITSEGYVGGAFIGEFNGKVAFFGDIQQSPNLVGIYELGEAAGSIQSERESAIVWSNALDRNMSLTDGDVNITVTLNSGDSPEGVTVQFTNLNATEQQLYPVADVTLDSIGFYAFDSFRRGDYRVTVSFDDYETITEEVSIWDVTALNYVLSEINYGLSNLYVSRTGWATWNDPKYGNAVPGIGAGDTFFVDFEDGALPADWTVIDADGDGYNWRINSELWDSSVLGYNGSTGFVVSQSYWNSVLYPDNYLVTNQLKLGGTLSFWACAQDASWAAEHFGIAVSINGNTNPSDFTMVQEWTMTAKGGDRAEGTRGDSRSQGTWYQYSVDLSAYAGQMGYIAFRHFNCSDMYVLDVDDISLDNGMASAKGNRHFNNYHVVLTDLEDNVLYQTTTTDCYMQLPIENLVDGQRYRLKVASDYSSGLGDWKVVDWNYQSCDNFEGVTDLNLEIGETANVLTWTYPTVEQRSILNGGYPAYGCRLYNGDNSNNPTGWYTFDLDTPEENSILNSSLYFAGGDYCPLDGYVHSTYSNGNSWYVIEPETGEIMDQGSMDIGFRDCAWDFTTNTMYGADGGDLYIWNIEDNTVNYIGYIGFTVQVLACDIEGQLYAINESGELYRIDKETGASTLVGNTGLNNYYWNSGGFDHYSGKLYWAGINGSAYGFFAEIDPETAETTVLANNTGQVTSFCVPFDGSDYISPVTGVLGAMLYRDGELLGFTRETRFTDSIMPGNHEYEVRVVYDGKKRTPNFNAYYAMSCPTSIGGATYDVTVAAVPTVGGTVTGSGTYINGFPCTVTAVENDGFVFTNWTVNGQVVSSIPEYTFRVRENTTIEANFIGFVPHWTVVDNPDYEPTSLIGVVQYNGVEQGANYLEVAALCGTECRGKQLMTYYPEDDRFYVFMTIYGNDNDVITFSVYDHMESEETDLYCLSRLNFVSNEIFGSTFDPYIIDFGVTQETAMQTGWNWYASAVEADGAEALEMLENSLGANGVMIKSQTDGFVMNYENYWVGNLTALSNDQMYMVKTDDQVNAFMAGYQSDVTTHSISIYPGWTWLGYPNGQAMDVNDALANFTAKNGDLLKAKQSFASYIEGQGWIGSLMTLNPGAGLMYNSTRNVTVSLTYAGQGNRQELMPNITAEQNHWVPNEFEYPDNMSVMAVVELAGIEIAEGGYELAVFDGNKCVGSAQLVYVEPINRYVAFLTVSSEEGSALHFALYDSMTGMEGLAENDAVAFEPNAIIGSLDQPYVVNFKGMTDVSQDYLVLDIYPNPVDKGSQFRIGVSSDKTDVVTVEIVDALGAVVSSTQTSRKSALVTAPVSAGVYMVRVCVNGGETYCRKLIVK